MAVCLNPKIDISRISGIGFDNIDVLPYIFTKNIKKKILMLSMIFFLVHMETNYMRLT